MIFEHPTPGSKGTYTSTSASTSAPFSQDVRSILMWATTDAYFTINTSSQAASANNVPIPAYTIAVLGIDQNVTSRVYPSAIAAESVSSSGTAYYKPVGGN